MICSVAAETEADLHGDYDLQPMNVVSYIKQIRMSGMSGTDYLLSAHLSAQEQYGCLNQQPIYQQKTTREMVSLASEVTALSTAIHSTNHFIPGKVHTVVSNTFPLKSYSSKHYFVAGIT